MLIGIDQIKSPALRSLCDLIIVDAEEGNEPIFKDGLFLAALGARICYSDKPPLELLATDHRIIDKEERVKFLTRLAKAGHYSVFAHSPIFVKYFYPGCAGALPYKAWWHDIEEEAGWTKRYVCANARHMMEAYSEDEDVQKRLISSVLEYDDSFSMKIFTATRDGIILHNTVPPEPKHKPYLVVFFIDKKPWQWFSVVIHGVSVIMTHQLVRHTWLNFSQRSHRYTKVDGFVIPSTIKNTVNEPIFESLIYRATDIYDELCRCGIPKEDARFVLPSGRETTIMASGPRFIWEDFVNKRNHSKAQWEIRWLVERMKEILDATKEE